MTLLSVCDGNLQKEALSEKIDELLNDGMSLEDILEKLK